MSEVAQIQTPLSENEIVFESYGVKIRIKASDIGLLDQAEQTARKALVSQFTLLEKTESENHLFEISEDETGTLFLFQNGEQISYDNRRPLFFKFFDSMVRIAVAEHAVGWVFIHAGVVGWKEKAIVLPANSFRGKTTLVEELVKRGAEYYSDEYAVLDEHGMVHPFPRNLSVRYLVGAEVNEKEVSIAELGGKTGTKPLPIGLVLITEYVENSAWKPDRLTRGQAIMEVLPHTIPRNFNTQFSLKVLNTALSDAIILKSLRGDASDLAIRLLSFFDNFSDLAKIT